MIDTEDVEELDAVIDVPQDLTGKIVEIDGRPKAIFVHESGAPGMTEWMPVPKVMPLGMNIMPLPDEIVISMYFLARANENANEALNKYITKYGVGGMGSSEDAIKAICKNRNAKPENKDNPWCIVEVQAVLDGIRVI